MKRAKWIYCRYCGAKLRRDHIGQFCPTPNCQWQHGLPKEDDSPGGRTIPPPLQPKT